MDEGPTMARGCIMGRPRREETTVQIVGPPWRVEMAVQMDGLVGCMCRGRLRPPSRVGEEGLASSGNKKATSWIKQGWLPPPPPNRHTFKYSPFEVGSRFRKKGAGWHPTKWRAPPPYGTWGGGLSPKKSPDYDQDLRCWERFRI